jgi:hypothetical protein
MEGSGENGLILQAIKHASVAGGLIAYARAEPGAARGLLKAAVHHEGRANALLEEFLAGGFGASTSPGHTPMF